MRVGVRVKPPILHEAVSRAVELVGSALEHANHAGAIYVTEVGG